MNTAAASQSISPELTAYRAAVEAHGDAGYAASACRYGRPESLCKCGRTFHTPQGRGAHEAAARRAAGKVLDEARQTARADA